MPRIAEVQNKTLRIEHILITERPLHRKRTRMKYLGHEEIVMKEVSRGQ
jgi:hypothetical protein